jgi:hypothetical protein
MKLENLKWKCPFCKRIYDHETACICPAWQEAHELPQEKYHSVDISHTDSEKEFSKNFLKSSFYKNQSSIIDPPENKPSNSIIFTGEFCPVCNGDIITVRGRHINSNKRTLCPACLADRMDMIKDIIIKR